MQSSHVPLLETGYFLCQVTMRLYPHIQHKKKLRTTLIAILCSFRTFQYEALHTFILAVSTGQLKCDGTRAETRFRLSAKRTSPFTSAGTSVQPTTGSRGVRISGSNAGYTMFRGSVKGTGYPFHSPISPSLPLPWRHRVPSHFNWSLIPYRRFGTT